MSISELVMILLVALLVMKPEQWPEVAYTIGRLVAFSRRLLDKMKHEINGLLDVHR